MLRKLSFVAAIMVVAITGILRADEDSNKDKQPATGGPAVLGCRFSVKADRSAYRYDQPIGLFLTVKNEGIKEVILVDTDLMGDFPFDVRLPNGKAAPLTLEGKRQLGVAGDGSAVTVELKGGKERIDSLPMLNRLYDMTLLGEYTVTVYREVTPAGGENVKPVRLVSNTLKIVVHDKDALSPTTKPSKAE